MSIAIKRVPRRQLVDYDQIRDDIRSGDLLFCSGSGFFSRMIQRSRGSIWSHVGLLMRLEAIDRVMVLESLEPQGVRTVPLRKYLVDYDNEGKPYPGAVVIGRHKAVETASKNGLRRLGQFAADLFGYPYDKDEIAKIAARIAGSYVPFTQTERRALRRDREYICSEYVWECYRQLGIHIEYDPRGFIAPSDFASASEVELVAVLKYK